MSYQLIIVGVGIATALYYLITSCKVNKHNEHKYHTYGVDKSWDHEEKYKNKPAECALCLEIMLPNSHLTLNPCKHTFHRNCIGIFMQTNDEGICPICRQPFS
ncbi:uncharacterized protein LOC143346135 [Colletes latitarsis]|uniref:uncharacterized protein LOC143346135 n=1 Tax=Colletes latitarsis TaxID=2605962 RepID=UPI00403698D6